jgi:hypothetical protein
MPACISIGWTAWTVDRPTTDDARGGAPSRAVDEYEDTIRVADLKVRASRFARVRGVVKAKDDQIVRVTEYMHPRLEEICETLPSRSDARILASKRLSGWLRPVSQGAACRDDESPLVPDAVGAGRLAALAARHAAL